MKKRVKQSSSGRQGAVKSAVKVPLKVLSRCRLKCRRAKLTRVEEHHSQGEGGAGAGHVDVDAVPFADLFKKRTN